MRTFAWNGFGLKVMEFYGANQSESNFLKKYHGVGNFKFWDFPKPPLEKFIKSFLKVSRDDTPKNKIQKKFKKP